MFPFHRIALVGFGNVGYTYYKVLKNIGVELAYIFIRDKKKQCEVKETTGVEIVTDYQKLLNCELIIIAVNDDAIKDVASHLEGFGGLLLHTSGTQPSDVLNVVENYGVLYPLQTLTKDYDLNFKKVPLLVNASSDDNLNKLKSLAQMMSDVVLECSDDKRARIHMSAVYVSNFVNVMLQIGDGLLNEINLDVSLLEPLVKETVNKSFAMSPEKALTGPAKRADMKTINKHKSMLTNNLEEKNIYEILTNYIINKYRNNEKL